MVQCVLCISQPRMKTNCKDKCIDPPRSQEAGEQCAQRIKLCHCSSIRGTVSGRPTVLAYLYICTMECCVSHTNTPPKYPLKPYVVACSSAAPEFPALGYQKLRTARWPA